MEIENISFFDRLENDEKDYNIFINYLKKKMDLYEFKNLIVYRK